MRLLPFVVALGAAVSATSLVRADEPVEPVKVVPVQQPDGTVVLVPLSQLQTPQPAAPQVVIIDSRAEERPATLPYDIGDPVPAGYKPDSKPITGLVIAGPIVFGVGWMASALAGVIGGAESFGGDKGMYAFMIPAVGGLVAIGTVEPANREGATIGGVTSFLVQSAGIGMLIGGLAAERPILRRTGFDVSPTVAADPSGGILGVSGRF